MSVRQWEGSSDQNDKSGIAVIVVGGHTIRMKLESFRDFLDIGFALESEYKLGVEKTTERLNMLIGDVFRNQFGIIQNEIMKSPEQLEAEFAEGEREMMYGTFGGR